MRRRARPAMAVKCVDRPVARGACLAEGGRQIASFLSCRRKAPVPALKSAGRHGSRPGCPVFSVRSRLRGFLAGRCNRHCRAYSEPPHPFVC